MNITCPACGTVLKGDGELKKHIVECRDLRGSGPQGSVLEPSERKRGARYGESVKKPDLDFYDRH